MTDNRILDVNLHACKDIPTIYSIALQVCKDMNISISEMRSRSRRENLVQARYELSIQAKEYGYTREQMAAFLGRHHSSITYLINKYNPPA